MPKYKIVAEVIKTYEVEIEAPDAESALSNLERFPGDLEAGKLVGVAYSDPEEWVVTDLSVPERIVAGLRALQKAADLIHRLGLEDEKGVDEILSALGDLRELGNVEDLV